MTYGTTPEEFYNITNVTSKLRYLRIFEITPSKSGTIEQLPIPAAHFCTARAFPVTVKMHVVLSPPPLLWGLSLILCWKGGNRARTFL